MTFNDQFSRQADIYAKGRPTYPDELFTYLSSLSPGRDLVWDCATGNGQAAVSLKDHFTEVIATDASEQQIKNAQERPGITYKTASAYNSGLPDSSADLVTVATAAHWFNIHDFYKEADRVLKDKGVLAIWCYSIAQISPEVDTVIENLTFSMLKDHWPPERRHVDERYKGLPFPYPEIKPPAFACRMNWNLAQLAVYLRSWSAAQNYVNHNGNDPIQIIFPELLKAWGDKDSKKVVTWDLCMRIGRK